MIFYPGRFRKNAQHPAPKNLCSKSSAASCRRGKSRTGFDFCMSVEILDISNGREGAEIYLPVGQP